MKLACPQFSKTAGQKLSLAVGSCSIIAVHPLVTYPRDQPEIQNPKIEHRQLTKLQIHDLSPGCLYPTTRTTQFCLLRNKNFSHPMTRKSTTVLPLRYGESNPGRRGFLILKTRNVGHYTISDEDFRGSGKRITTMPSSAQIRPWSKSEAYLMTFLSRYLGT